LRKDQDYLSEKYSSGAQGELKNKEELFLLNKKALEKGYSRG